MIKSVLLLFIILFFKCSGIAQENYLGYHAKVTECEQLVVERNFAAAIVKLDALFNQFDFVFLRDIKMAAGLSAFVKDDESAFRFIRLGITAGWTLKSINKNDNLKYLTDDHQWTKLVSEYDSLRRIYLTRLNSQLREQVHEMFKKDQKMAFRALFRIGQKSQEKYTEKDFAPHSEKQIALLDSLLKQYGYPGELIIGNHLWASVILSHHNSISRNYNSKDTLYTQLRPKLLEALKRGEISPYEFAQMEDWRTAGLHDHELTAYGFIGKIPDNNVLKRVNKNRADIGMRSVELRNDLIDLEKSTGLDLYLPKGWQRGKITPVDN